MDTMEHVCLTLDIALGYNAEQAVMDIINKAMGEVSTKCGFPVTLQFRQKYGAGEVVRLKSGGPKMTIVGVEDDLARLVYFPYDGLGVKEINAIPLICLEK